MIRLLIADDHPIVRHGLVQIVSREVDMQVVAEAGDSAQALDAGQRTEVDVAVHDLAMPGRGELDVLRELKRVRPALPVLILSMYGEDVFAMRALKAGAHGYLTKESAAGELVQAVRTVMAGRRYVTTALAERLAALVGGAMTPNPHEQLSDREMAVFRLLAGGHTVTQAADDLALSVKTVSTYRARLLRKLNLRTTADLVRYAVDHGI